jgi:hypothetical protein
MRGNFMDAIRKIIKPEGRKISIELPLNMASKTVEVIILPVEEKPVKRACGSAKGMGSVPDTFFDPLPDEFLKSFGNI